MQKGIYIDSEHDLESRSHAGPSQKKPIPYFSPTAGVWMEDKGSSSSTSLKGQPDNGGWNRTSIWRSFQDLYKVYSEWNLEGF